MTDVIRMFMEQRRLDLIEDLKSLHNIVKQIERGEQDVQGNK